MNSMNAEAELALLQTLRNTPEVFDAVNQATGSELAIQRTLRQQFGDDVVRAALTLSDLRGKAADTLPNAQALWLTRVGLEQSTAWQVAQHKAARFPDDVHVHDLCCGIGVDSAALLQRGPVTSVDCDPAMIQRCIWNVDEWVADAKYAHATQVADVRSIDCADLVVHVDPDRRAHGDRPTRRLEQYSPDLAWMQNLTEVAKAGAIKLGPASNFMQKFPRCEIELISLNGECREATVWFGQLSGEATFRATVLPSGESIAADPLSVWMPPASSVGRYIFDPDPAVVRSGLLDVVADRFGLQRLDDTDEYLTGDVVPPTAFVRVFEVEAVLSNNDRELKRHLRTAPSTHYEIKCRRVSVKADAIRRRLPVGDAEPRTILFVRINGKSHIVVARRPSPPDPDS